jgi:ubiquinone/menaquinone biosynthesis C-methylase UbiE
MPDDAKRSVQSQFARQAAWYTVSSVHRHSEGLEALLRLAAPAASDRALDVATGTGFTAFALAPRCGRVVAMDMTAGMVREAQGLRATRGIANVEFCLGDAEALPFRDGSFDLVTCRQAAHHFPHIERALAEMARVARPGGRVLLDDTCTPEDDELAAVMNDWELRRDPSHARNYRPSQLRAMFAACGLRVADTAPAQVYLQFGDWVRRSGVPAAKAAALRESFLRASPAAVEAFRIRQQDDDIHFAWTEVVILGVKS